MSRLDSLRDSLPENALNQLTLRGFEPELERRIRDLARREGISLNQAVLRLLRKGAGLAREKRDDEDAVGHSLDHLFGTWTDEQAREFEEAIRDLESIDESLWR